MNPVEAWRRLSPRDRRAIRLGALTLLPVLLWVFLASPYLDAVRRNHSRLDAQRSLLRAERDLLAARGRYPEAVRSAGLRLQRVAPTLLDSRSPGVATAELTQFVEDRALASRVHLTRTDPRPVRRLDRRLVAVPLVVECESDLEGLLTLLDLLEGGAKRLRVEAVRLRRVDPSTGADDMQVLRLDATVTGFMLYPDERRDSDDTPAPDVTASPPKDGTDPAASLARRPGVRP